VPVSPSRVEQPLAPAGRPGPDRRRAALALVVTAVLVAAAGIGSGRSLAHVGGPRRVLDVASFASDLLVVVGVLLLGVLVLGLVHGRRRRGEAPVHTPARFRSQLLLLVWSLAAFFVARYSRSDRQTPGGLHPPKQQPPHANRSHSGLPPPHWWPLAAVGLALLVAASIVVWRASRRRDAQFEDDAADAGDELREAIEISLADIEREPDPRRAVIRAYARMEQVFAGQGLPRAPHETPTEHLRRALSSLQVSRAAVERLAALFERARFSDHRIDAGMKHDALVALTDVQAELGER
jgi:hypothetical protein